MGNILDGDEPIAPSPLAHTPTDPSLWEFGVSLVILGCISSSIGLLLMKRSADVEDTLPLYKRWRWALGFVFLVGNATIIDLIAFAITPLSLIAPFAALTMVFSVVLAKSGLFGVHESLPGRQIVGIAFVVVGVTTVSVFGPHTSDEPTMAEIFDDFDNPAFIVFVSLTLSLVALYLVLLWTPRLEPYRPSPTSPWTTLFSAFCSAVCGAQSQLFLKVISVGLRFFTTGGDPDAAVTPAFILSLLGLAVTAPLQLYLLNSTLASSPIGYAVPLCTSTPLNAPLTASLHATECATDRTDQSLLIMLTVAAGGIFFKEFADISIARGVLFCVGGLIALGGLMILSLKAQSPAPTEEKVLLRRMSGLQPSPAEPAEERHDDFDSLEARAGTLGTGRR